MVTSELKCLFKDCMGNTVLNAVRHLLMQTQFSTPFKHVVFNYLNEDFSLKCLTQGDLKNLLKENLSMK